MGKILRTLLGILLKAYSLPVAYSHITGCIFEIDLAIQHPS
jgi:hypothetical protein